MDNTKLDEFTLAYIECALWSTNDESDPSGGIPIDTNYGIEDIDSETLEIIVRDCQSFQDDNLTDICDDIERAGHHFWLTRNGHGAGFWDGDWPEEIGERLTANSIAFGEVWLCVSGDKIYC